MENKRKTGNGRSGTISLWVIAAIVAVVGLGTYYIGSHQGEWRQKSLAVNQPSGPDSTWFPTTPGQPVGDQAPLPSADQASNPAAPAPAPENAVQPAQNPAGDYAEAPTAAADIATTGLNNQAADDFYQVLQPYGEWGTSRSYGRIWRPRVVSGWRPYTLGRWVYTDYGWTWVSSEPFGWVCFHYGRWYLDPVYGWVWCPDTEWAPAWVVWRTSNDYVGWAPIPPRIRWRHDRGFDMRGINLTVIVTTRDFSFCEARHFMDADLHRAILAPGRNNTATRGTRISLDIQVQNNRIVNRLPVEKRIEQLAGRPIPQYRVVDATAPGAGRLEGNQVRIFRPNLAAPKPKTPAGPLRSVQPAPKAQERQKGPQRPQQSPARQQQPLQQPARENRQVQQPQAQQPQRGVSQQPARQQRNVEQSTQPRPQPRQQPGPQRGAEQRQQAPRPQAQQTQVQPQQRIAPRPQPQQQRVTPQQRQPQQPPAAVESRQRPQPQVQQPQRETRQQQVIPQRQAGENVPARQPQAQQQRLAPQQQSQSQQQVQQQRVGPQKGDSKQQEDEKNRKKQDQTQPAGN